MTESYEELVQMSRLALNGDKRDIELFISKLSRRFRSTQPEVSKKLDSLLTERPTRGTPLRKTPKDPQEAIPVDLDSRLQLAKPEYPVSLECDPLWSDLIDRRLSQIVAERQRQDELAAQGLAPTKTMLFTGEPGVGKTLAARYLASKLDRPLLTLDLSAVMSSFLGRTGTNVRQILDYAKSVECVLFLDELDAVAKRRDDEAELGELKRLVTVLLQEIDEWPASGTLVAATNHPDLLDPAIWRRFDMVIEFPMPTSAQIRQMVRRSLEPRGVPDESIEILSSALCECSFSDIDREMRRAHRESVISQEPLEALLPSIARHAISMLPLARRKQIAVKLRKQFGMTERATYDWTGVSRDTQRKAITQTD